MANTLLALFYQLCAPGDLVLTDRGFTIQDSVGLHCAEVKAPPYTKGKRQLSRCEIDWSWDISHVRIHVEQIIELLNRDTKSCNINFQYLYLKVQTLAQLMTSSPHMLPWPI